MQLIDIVPNRVKIVSEEEGDRLKLTRTFNVESFMRSHLKLSRAGQFMETAELLEDLSQSTSNLIELASMLNKFAQMCSDVANHLKSNSLVVNSLEVNSLLDLANSLQVVTLPFATLSGKKTDYSHILDRIAATDIDDLRHEETSKIYQRYLNLSNAYVLLLELANTLSRQILELELGTLSEAEREVAEVVHSITEEKRYVY